MCSASLDGQPSKVRVLCFPSRLTHTHVYASFFSCSISEPYKHTMITWSSVLLSFSGFFYLIPDTNFTQFWHTQLSTTTIISAYVTIMTMALHLPFDHIAKCLLEVLIGTQQMVSTPLQITRCTLC